MTDSKTSSGSEGDKVQLDQFEASFDLEAPSRKVELDLDDAPFLEWEEPEAAEEEDGEEQAAEEAEEDEEDEAPSWKRRFWWVLLAAATLGTLAALAYVLLFGTDLFRSSAPEKTDPAARTYQEKSREPVRTDLEPFLVEFTAGQENAAYRYLHFACALYTKNLDVAEELASRRAELREVIYDYLQSKDHPPLTDKKSMAALKQGLLQTLNANVAAGGFDQVMIQEYLVY